MTICRCTAAPSELAGGSLAAANTVALTRFVDLADGQQEGHDEITVKVGRGRWAQAALRRPPAW